MTSVRILTATATSNLLFVMTALVTKSFVLTTNCRNSEEPLQSECSDWLSMPLSVYRDCPYIECPYIKCRCNESSLYNKEYATAGAVIILDSDSTR